MEVATGPVPPPPPVDTPEARDSLECPLCGYSLRGLAAAGCDGARCPECGYPFRWAELLAARQYRHPYLFEEYPRNNAWSFVRTVAGGLRPGRFWSSLNAAHAVRPRRLVFYWVIVALVVLTAGVGGGYAATGMTLYRNHLRQRVFYSNAWGMSPGMINRTYPLPPDPAFFQMVWESEYHRSLAAYLTVAALAWPWLSMATLLIFRHAMRAARIRSGHVMRCVVYSADVFLWLGPLAVALAYVWFQPGDGFERSDGARADAWRAVLPLAILGTVFTYRLGVSYVRYLRLEHPWATVLLSQTVVGLFVVTVVSALSRDFFWLLF